MLLGSTSVESYIWVEKPILLSHVDHFYYGKNKAFILVWLKNRKQNHENFKYHICGGLRDLVPFVHFKKSEKHPCRSVTFSKVARFSLTLKITLSHGAFSCFLHRVHGTKLRNAPHISKTSSGLPCNDLKIMHQIHKKYIKKNTNLMFHVQIQKFTPTKNPKYLEDYEVWVRSNTIRFHASQRLIKNLD